jgi:glycosyltransferase involved in cell wall biosynthesis
MLDNEFPPLGGGMGTVNLALFNQFSQLPDIEIDLVTAALDGHSEQTTFSDRIHIYKVPVWNRNIHHSTNRELILYAIQALNKASWLHHTRRYDFCFSWSALPAGAVALLLYYLVGLPYLVWVSGPDIPGFERRYQRLYPIFLPLIRSVWVNARTLIAKCPEEADMIHASAPSIEVTIIPNGVDLEGFSPGLTFPDDGPFQVICVARLIERKGQHHLIQAVKQLADQGIDVYVSLVGTGDSKDDYHRVAHDLGVEDRIKFLGYVPREKIAEYYRTSHCFVLPSFNEGMALAALEAMASGLPLILTRTGGTDNLVKDGVNGYTFIWADTTALASHLRHLALDRGLLRRMGEESRKLAQPFSWEMIARSYMDLFTQTLSSPNL